MKRALIAALLLPLTVHAMLPEPHTTGAPDDVRYCGEPQRAKDGRILRSKVALKLFVATFPCPATLENVTSCQGWAIDHVLPLADGGCDAPFNMQWLPLGIKSCAGLLCKDRWERVYNAIPRQKVLIPTPPPQ